jgi:hypothetical protein
MAPRGEGTSAAVPWGSPPSGGSFLAVAVGFDGALTESGRPSGAVLEAVAATRDAGRKVILV